MPTGQATLARVVGLLPTDEQQHRPRVPFEGHGGAAADAIGRIAVRLAAFSRIAN